MFSVGYFDGVERRGILVFQEPDGPGNPSSAMGGIEPGNVRQAKEPITVVTHDDSERCFYGWVHPDQLWELGGKDRARPHPGVVKETRQRVGIPGDITWDEADERGYKFIP